MECGNLTLFGKAFVLRFVGSETTELVSSVNAVQIRLSASTFGEVIFINDGVATIRRFLWEAAN